MITVNVTLVIQLGLFLSLMVILNKLMIRPMLDVLDKRAELVGGSDAEYERLLQLSASMDGQYKQGLNDARLSGAAEAARIEGEARAEAQAMTDAKRTEVANRVREFRDSLERQVKGAARNLDSAIGELADQIHNRLVRG